MERSSLFSLEHIMSIFDLWTTFKNYDGQNATQTLNTACKNQVVQKSAMLKYCWEKKIADGAEWKPPLLLW